MSDDPSQSRGTPAPSSGPAVEVVHVPEERRYEVRVGGALAGFAEYVAKAHRVVFTHTEIDPSYEGQGLGSQVARAALDDVRASGNVAVPLCPFIAGWIAKHPEYDDIVDHAMLRALEER